MKTARHIVIDIETLGRRNDAAIAQIGVVVADETFIVLDKYLIQIFSEAWDTCNRTFTGKTLLWWMKQKNLPISNIGASSARSYYTAISTLNGIFKDIIQMILLYGLKVLWIYSALKIYVNI